MSLEHALLIYGIDDDGGVVFPEATAVDGSANPLTPIDYTDGDGDWRAFEGLTDGELVVSVGGDFEVEYYGGGGGGGSRVNSCGGGGAGGRIKYSVYLAPGVYPWVIGNGGLGALASESGAHGQSGGPTSFNGLDAEGGGGGGAHQTVQELLDGKDGGCGGGGGARDTSESGIGGTGSQGGNGGNALLEMAMDALPTSRQYYRGDRIIGIDKTWICTASGQPGTWEEIESEPEDLP